MRVFADRPVVLDVVPDGLDQFTGDIAQCLVAKDLHGVIVCQRVAERRLVGRDRTASPRGTRIAQCLGRAEAIPRPAKVGRVTR